MGCRGTVIVELCWGLLIVDFGFVLPCPSSYRTGEM